MNKPKTKDCVADKAKNVSNMDKKPCKLPKLGARLQNAYNEVLKLAQQGDIVADVGTDHGYLAAHLAKSGVFSSVLATDISKPSLKKAEILCESLGLDVKCASGDGLLAAPDCTIAAICGMGGWEIIKILQQPNIATRFVFVAMQNPKELREYLLKNKYLLIADYLVSEHNKFYFVMSAVKPSIVKIYRQVSADLGLNKHKPPKYGKMELYFGQNFDAKSKLGQLYLINQINNLNFFANFDKISALKKQKETWQKYKYYKLCNKLLQEGQNDPRYN